MAKLNLKGVTSPAIIYGRGKRQNKSLVEEIKEERKLSSSRVVSDHEDRRYKEKVIRQREEKEFALKNPKLAAEIAAKKAATQLAAKQRYDQKSKGKRKYKKKTII